MVTVAEGGSRLNAEGISNLYDSKPLLYFYAAYRYIHQGGDIIIHIRLKTPPYTNHF
jgi:hypothetical protein